ncbi:MAG: DUF3087 family protein [Glaciecola sp.]|nr:DUF3087 family protein [Glaciecola sp.]
MQQIKINSLIDKVRYRRHLNIVIVAAIITLIVGSLGIAQALIALYPDPSGRHFHWNITGVIITSLAIGLVLNKYRSHDFMTEVTYVWNLKQALNKINRKMLRITPASEMGNYHAMLALQYSYAGSRLLWQLDDNTIIMEELAIAQAKLDGLATQYGMILDVEDYTEHMLQQIPKAKA